MDFISYTCTTHGTRVMESAWVLNIFFRESIVQLIIHDVRVSYK